MTKRHRICLLSFVLCLLIPATATAAPGDLSPSFSADGYDIQDLGVNDVVHDVALQPDGKILVVGGEGPDAGRSAFVMRYLPDGTLDPDFGSGGKAIVSFAPGIAEANAVVLQPGGKILIAGRTSLDVAGTSAASEDNLALARLLPSGALDATFHHPGGGGANKDGRLVIDAGGFDSLTSVALQGDGSIVAAGFSDPAGAPTSDTVLQLVGADGQFPPRTGTHVIDVSGGSFNDFGRAVAVQSDGRIVVATEELHSGAFAVLRFDSLGNPDNSFDGDGKRFVDFGARSDNPSSLAIDAAGRIVVAGTEGDFAEPESAAIARLNPGDGSDDTTFGTGGRATPDVSSAFSSGRDVAIRPDGRIVLFGAGSFRADHADIAATQLTPSGAPDPSFGNVSGHPGVATVAFPGVPDVAGESVAIEPSGDLVVVGSASSSGAEPRDVLTARLKGADAQPAGGGAPPPAAQPPAGQQPDVVAPVIQLLKVQAVFRAATKGPSVKPRTTVGGNVIYDLSEAAGTRFAVQRPSTGRMPGSTCVKTTGRNHRAPKCTLWTTIGSFRHDGAAGRNRFRFTGRLGGRVTGLRGGGKLAPGNYRVAAVATDAAGNKSAEKHAKFRIARR